MTDFIEYGVYVISPLYPLHSPPLNYPKSPPLDHSKCRFFKYCKSINKTSNRVFYCLNIMDRCLQDMSWKQRAVYSYTPYKDKLDNVKFSLQFSNPFYRLGVDLKCPYLTGQNVAIPIINYKKPLFYDIDQTLVSKEKIFKINIPPRFEAAKATAALLISTSKFLQSFHNKCSIRLDVSDDNILDFVSTLIASGYNRSKTYSNFSSQMKILKEEIYEYSIFSPSNLNSHYEKSFREFVDFVLDFKKIRKKKLKNVSVNYFVRSILLKSEQYWNSLSSSDRQKEIELIYQKCNMIYRVLFRLKQIISKPNPSIFPILAIRDYLYLSKGDKNKNIVLFVKMATIYMKEIENLIKRMYVYPEDSITPILLEKADDFVTLTIYIDEAFLLLLPLDINSEDSILKLNTSNKSEVKLGQYFYSINLKAANSTHFKLSVSDIGYKILKPKKEIRDFFGRNECNSNFIHFNTGKKWNVPPYMRDSSNQLMHEDSHFRIPIKYRLTGSILAWMCVLCVVLVLPLFLKIENIQISLIYILIPVASIWVTTFSMGTWNLTHNKLRPFKIIILIICFFWVFKVGFSIYESNIVVINELLDKLEIYVKD